MGFRSSSRTASAAVSALGAGYLKSACFGLGGVALEYCLGLLHQVLGEGAVDVLVIAQHI